MKSGPARFARAFGCLAGGALILFGGIEVLARADTRRNRAARAHLGDLLFVEQRGQGDPVIFIAGLQGSTRYWGSALDPLASHHRLIYVDLLGFGRSPWPADVEYSMEDHIEWLRRTLVGAGATSNVTVVGHSMGAIVAAEYTRRFPEEVSRVVLAATPVFDTPAEARKRIRQMSPLAALFSLNPLFAREGCMTHEALRPLLYTTLPMLMRGRRPEVVQDALLHHWSSFQGTMQHVLLRTPAAEAVMEIGPKTTLLHGTEDTVTPLARIRRLAADSGADLVVIQGGHHDYVPWIRAELQKGGRPGRIE